MEEIKTIRICHAPNSPGMEVACGVTFQLVPPRSLTLATLMVDPTAHLHNEVSGFMMEMQIHAVSGNSLQFDMQGQREHVLRSLGGEQTLTVRLLRIEPAGWTFEGKGYPVYEFLVTKSDEA
ncbi:MAG: hypothetical protein HOP28_12245 [Gemmatimonadales bacterium]|nr:hypothetical protein [Gemmatimonadales bacterium]